MADRRADDILSDEAVTGEPGSPPEPRLSRWSRFKRALRNPDWSSVPRYFKTQDPTFWVAFTPALVVGALLFVRNPLSNYIFDEQEALLANPYVNGSGLGFLDVFKRDFWGLPPTRSIGSYRPLPNVIWRTVWSIHHNPWLMHWVNVVIHALNATLIAGITLAVTRQRMTSWLAGAAFLVSAVLTEAVTGVVGIADVMGGLGVLLMLAATRLRWWLLPFGVFGAGMFGFLSKESVLIAVPLVPWFALVTAPALHPERPRRLLRALLAAGAVTGALVAYTYFRRAMFPVSLPEALQSPLPSSEPLMKRAMHEFLRWFQQPRLPQDPINNPLIDADFPHRVAGALRVYWRGLCQVVFPWTLSGDYSYAQEPAPDRLVFPASVSGAVAFVASPLAGVAFWFRALALERRERGGAAEGPRVWSTALTASVLLAVGLVWVPIAYFPHSNVPTLLPTVRAERFWYLPVVGSALVFATAYAAIYRGAARRSRATIALVVIGSLLGFQAIRARLHAFDYNDDLAFWRATARASPNSAKAHLNYGVMLGARGRLEERLAENGLALDLAPQWPMAHVYYGDTLCRMHRAADAWPHYVRGFELAPNDSNLISLALQCLWDEKALEEHKSELLELAAEHPGSWLAYLGRDIVYHGEEHGGVQKKYRPRGYDEGPKK